MIQLRLPILFVSTVTLWTVIQGFCSRWIFIAHKYSVVQLGSINSTLSTLKQYVSEQSFHSSFTIPRVSQETPPTGLLQAGYSTQPKTDLSSSLSRCPLTLDHKTALSNSLSSCPQTLDHKTALSSSKTVALFSIFALLRS
jgi:hypothetical protein